MASRFWENEKRKTQESLNNHTRSLEIMPKTLLKKSIVTNPTKKMQTEPASRKPDTSPRKSAKVRHLSKAECEKHIKAAYYKMVAEMERVKNSLEYSDEIFDEDAAMRKYSRNLDSQHCPECHYDFGKSLSRGRLCPNCHQKLRVRNFRIVGPTYLNKLDSIYQEWRKYFEASIHKQWFDNHIKWSWPIDPMEAISNMAEVYEKLEDYDNAWQTFSGIGLPTLDIWYIWILARQEDNECSDDDMLYIEFWRAEFLDRRYSSKTWKTSLRQVVDAYINVITQAQDLRVSLQCHSVLQSITKLSVLYQEPEEHEMIKQKLLSKGILDKIA